MNTTMLKAAAALLTLTLTVTPGMSQGNGNGNGNGGAGHGASDSAPGHNKGDGSEAAGHAPGHMKGAGENASAYAPGKTIARGSSSTASVSGSNFGSLISNIRAGKSDLTGIDRQAQVTIIDASELAAGRPALANALRDNRERIEQLRGDLAAMDLDNLPDAEAAAAVAARVEPDGSLTLFVE